MAMVKVISDRLHHTRAGWFGDSSASHVCEESGEEMVLMNDQSGRIIGFEKLNLLAAKECNGREGSIGNILWVLCAAIRPNQTIPRGFIHDGRARLRRAKESSCRMSRLDACLCGARRQGVSPSQGLVAAPPRGGLCTARVQNHRRLRGLSGRVRLCRTLIPPGMSRLDGVSPSQGLVAAALRCGLCVLSRPTTWLWLRRHAPLHPHTHSSIQFHLPAP